MTDATTGPGVVTPPTTQCPRCGDTVPVGGFCGACGAHLDTAVAHGAHRAHAYAFAPGEHLLQPSVITTMFPQLPHRARAPFRTGAALILAAVVVLGLLRLQAPLVAVCAAAIPLLFQLYLFEVDVYEDYRWHEAALILGVGAALGAVWAAFTGPIVTSAVASSFAGGVTHRDFWVAGVLIPGGAQLLMLVPAALAWFLRGSRTEAMDGFVMGSAGALGFVLTSTLTRLWPQLSTGVVANHRSAASVVVEGLVQGITLPVVAGCAGGLVAATWWLRRRSAVHGGRWATSMPAALVLVVAVQIGLGIADLWQPALATLLALHAAAALLLLLALRVALHFVVLHEEHEVVIGPPQVCHHCHHVVPAMPFCPHCGVARHGSTRSSRAALTLGASEVGA